jgi:hypothetical protein
MNFWFRSGQVSLVDMWCVVQIEVGDGDTILVSCSDDVQTVEIIANLALADRTAVLRKLHIQGAGPNTLGPAALRELIKWVKNKRDVDELRIEGATRTSGAGPGRIPRPIVF